MRGQFDDAGAALVLLGCCQDTGDDGSLGSGSHGLERNRTNVGFHGAAQGSIRETRCDRGAHQVGGCRLPVRTSHCHRCQACGGGGVDIGTQLRNDGARVGHLNDGHAQASFEGLRAALLVGEDDTRPCFYRGVRETNAMLFETGNRDKQPVRLAVVG